MTNWNYEYYENPIRDKHATISVLTFKKDELSEQDDYLKEVEQTYEIKWLKPMLSTFEQEWIRIKTKHNARFYNRGKNIALECLQFGGNHEFWDNFPDEYEILAYFKRCYAFAIETIGYKQTDTNIICAIIVTEPNRRNLFVYYLPLTNSWQRKVCGNEFSQCGSRLQLRNDDGEPIYRTIHSDVKPLLCHSEFWKQRGGLTSYSDLQERFYNEISYRYGAERGESLSRLKYTSKEQIKRFNRKEGDDYDVMPITSDIWI